MCLYFKFSVYFSFSEDLNCVLLGILHRAPNVTREPAHHPKTAAAQTNKDDEILLLSFLCVKLKSKQPSGVFWYKQADVCLVHVLVGRLMTLTKFPLGQRWGETGASMRKAT